MFDKSKKRMERISQESSEERLTPAQLSKVREYVSLYTSIVAHYFELSRSSWLPPQSRKNLRILLSRAKQELPKELQDESFIRYVSGIEEKL